jgi:amino acid transporter
MATPQLKRTLSLPLLTFYGLGSILGAGVYVLLGTVSAAAGRFLPVSFLCATVIAGFTAFSYAEFSARLPRSGGEAVYVDAAFGARPPSRSVRLTHCRINQVVQPNSEDSSL